MGWNRTTTGAGKDRDGDLAGLQQLLDGHGADRTRWPARERLRFATLIAEDRDAQRLLREAEALDRLIDMGPRARPAREAELAARIVAAAVTESRPSEPAVRSAGPVAIAVRPRRLVMAMRRLLPAAGLLAASLLVGVIVGGAGLMSPTLQSIATAVGVSGDIDSPQLAQLGDPGFEEEQL
jgi:hypothetical protein